MESSEPKKKILLVEDELFIRELYARALLKDGYDIEQVDDGLEAYKRMSQGGYDLVLLDVMLPRLDGIDILNKLKNQPPKQPNKGIIVLTNLDEELTIAKGISMGIRGYLIKSQCTPDNLREEVKRYFSAPI